MKIRKHLRIHVERSTQVRTTFLVGFLSCDCWDATTSNDALTSFSSCIDVSRGSNKVVASSVMAESTECQKRLRENKLIEIPKLKKSWSICFRILS